MIILNTKNSEQNLFTAESCRRQCIVIILIAAVRDKIIFNACRSLDEACQEAECITEVGPYIHVYNYTCIYIITYSNEDFEPSNGFLCFRVFRYGVRLLEDMFPSTSLFSATDIQ